MKKVVVKFGLLAVIVMMTAGISAKAQSLQYRLTVNIPFAFTVSDTKLPAGKYWIKRAESTSGDQIVQIGSVDGNANVLRLTIPVISRDPADQGMLVFRQYGDEYFLFEIWPAGGHTGRELPKSHAEREAESKVSDAKIARVVFR